MALTKTIQDALNRQLHDELSAAYSYLAMSAYCTAQNLNGFAHWLRIQAREEAGHAMRLYDFVQDRGGRVTLDAVDRPPADYQSALDVAEQALRHEQRVSTAINDLYGLTVQEKDWASQAFLQWFVTEQVEEEKTATQLVETLRMIGNDRAGLVMLDRELGTRQAAATP